MAIQFFQSWDLTTQYRSIEDLRSLLEDQSNQEIIFSGGELHRYFSHLDGGADQQSLPNLHFRNNSLRFIDCKIIGFNLDFSGAQFDDANLIFEECELRNCIINFSGSTFKSGNIKVSGKQADRSKFLFEGCNLGAGDVEIDFGTLSKSELNFGESSRLEDGNLNIMLDEVTDSHIDFSGFEHLKGDFEFIDGKIIRSTLDFSKFHSKNGRFTLSGVEFSGAKDDRGEYPYKLDFSDANFGEGYVDLSSLSFTDTELRAEGTDFGSGNVSCAGLILNNARADFAQAKLKQGTFDFQDCNLADHSKLSLSSANIDGKILRFSRLNITDSSANLSGANINCDWVEFSQFKIASSNILRSALHLEETIISANRLIFSDSYFDNSLLRAKGMTFDGRSVAFDYIKFENDGLFDLTGTTFNCDEFSMMNATLDLEKLSWGKVTIDANQIGFNQSTLKGRLLNFWHAKFKARQIVFDDCSWSGTRLDFEGTEFSARELNFQRNNFESDFTYFNGAKFPSRKVKFDNSKFSGRASFADIAQVDEAGEFSFRHCVFDNSFDLSSNDEFGCVVDLTRTKMSNQFSIENVSCAFNANPKKSLGNAIVWPIKRFVPKPWTLALRRFILKRPWLSQHKIKDKRDIERFRRLKQIAGDNKSTRQALDYRVKETQAERWHNSKTDIFLEFWFSVLSDYGRREPRVLAWLGSSWAIFSYFYYSASEAKLTITEKATSALFYSLSNIIPFIPISRTSRIENAEILFGDGQKDFDLPNRIIALASVQSLISVLLLFLFGLAIRNRFKI